MNGVQLLKDVKKEVCRIRKKINKVEDQEKKQRLRRAYDELIDAFDIPSARKKFNQFGNRR